ncbi:MAG: class I SAM-dependent methyltransferase, partial [Bacteroidota bacterium]
ISTHRFEQIIHENQLIVAHKKHFLFNPIYKYKFGLEPREQASWISSIPHLRDFFTTAGWYIIKQPD